MTGREPRDPSRELRAVTDEELDVLTARANAARDLAKLALSALDEVGIPLRGPRAELFVAACQVLYGQDRPPPGEPGQVPWTHPRFRGGDS